MDKKGLNNTIRNKKDVIKDNNIKGKNSSVPMLFLFSLLGSLSGAFLLTLFYYLSGEGFGAIFTVMSSIVVVPAITLVLGAWAAFLGQMDTRIIYWMTLVITPLTCRMVLEIL